MDNRVQNVLVVGNDGSGKTDLIKHLSDGLDGLRIAGFWTEQVLDSDGRSRVFTFADEVLEYCTADADVANDLISTMTDPAEAVLIDEIDRALWCSREFRTAVGTLLNGPTPVVVTAQSCAAEFIEAHAKQPGLQVLELTPFNRAFVAQQILRRVGPAFQEIRAVPKL